MKALRTFMLAVDKTNIFIGKLMVGVTLLACAVITFEVVMRYAFNKPTNWGHETMILLFAVIYVAAGGYAHYYRAHVRVDVIYASLSPRGRAILDIITSAFFFTFMAGTRDASRRPCAGCCASGLNPGGDMATGDWPALNALLNGLSALLLSLGYVHIRRGRREAHRRCMLGATGTSVAFLISYLAYHASVQTVTRFVEPAWFRPIYLAILLTHTVLAAVLVPLVCATLFQALRAQFETHGRMARWAWPVWMYVSVTGVLIYLLLYRIFPQA